jgi:hypothetical protein
MKNYYESHKEYFREYNKNYRQTHKEYFREYGKNYRQTHKEYFREYLRRYSHFVKDDRYDLVENYELALADNFNNWCLHHKLETHTSDGVRRVVNLTRKELKELDMYNDRPPEELIWMKKRDHVLLHMGK